MISLALAELCLALDHPLYAYYGPGLVSCPLVRDITKALVTLAERTQ